MNAQPSPIGNEENDTDERLDPTGDAQPARQELDAPESQIHLEASTQTPMRKSRQTEAQEELVEIVGIKAERKLAAMGKERSSIWFGLGAFGVIGWSIAIPTLLGIALGLWLDVTLEDTFSWTLSLLLAGVMLGAFNAWYWVSKEQGEMEREMRRKLEKRLERKSDD